MTEETPEAHVELDSQEGRLGAETMGIEVNDHEIVRDDSGEQQQQPTTEQTANPNNVDESGEGELPMEGLEDFYVSEEVAGGEMDSQPLPNVTGNAMVDEDEHSDNVQPKRHGQINNNMPEVHTEEANEDNPLREIDENEGAGDSQKHASVATINADMHEQHIRNGNFQSVDDSDKLHAMKLCQNKEWDQLSQLLSDKPLLGLSVLSSPNNAFTTTILHHIIGSDGNENQRERIILQILDATPQAAQIRNHYDSLPLHAICLRQAPFTASPKKLIIDKLIDAYPEALLSKGAQTQRTPLHMILTAKSKANTELISTMILKGEKACFVKDNNGLLPIQIACSNRCSFGVVQLLLQVNPQSIHVRTQDNQSLLDLLLEEKSAQPNLLVVNEIRRQLGENPLTSVRTDKSFRRKSSISLDDSAASNRRRSSISLDEIAAGIKRKSLSVPGESPIDAKKTKSARSTQESQLEGQIQQGTISTIINIDENGKNSEAENTEGVTEASPEGEEQHQVWECEYCDKKYRTMQEAMDCEELCSKKPPAEADEGVDAAPPFAIGDQIPTSQHRELIEFEEEAVRLLDGFSLEWDQEEYDKIDVSYWKACYLVARFAQLLFRFDSINQYINWRMTKTVELKGKERYVFIRAYTEHSNNRQYFGSTGRMKAPGALLQESRFIKLAKKLFKENPQTEDCFSLMLDLNKRGTFRTQSELDNYMLVSRRRSGEANPESAPKKTNRVPSLLNSVAKTFRGLSVSQLSLMESTPEYKKLQKALDSFSGFITTFSQETSSGNGNDPVNEDERDIVEQAREWASNTLDLEEIPIPKTPDPITVAAAAEESETNPPAASKTGPEEILPDNTVATAVGKKYSRSNVRARTSTDGTVAPVNEPKLSKDGLFVRPVGRTRKGMDWDENQGIWVPENPAPLTEHAIVGETVAKDGGGPGNQRTTNDSSLALSISDDAAREPNETQNPSVDNAETEHLAMESSFLDMDFDEETLKQSELAAVAALSVPEESSTKTLDFDEETLEHSDLAAATLSVPEESSTKTLDIPEEEVVEADMPFGGADRPRVSPFSEELNGPGDDNGAETARPTQRNDNNDEACRSPSPPTPKVPPKVDPPQPLLLHDEHLQQANKAAEGYDVAQIDDYISQISQQRSGFVWNGGKCLKILKAYVGNVVDDPKEEKYKTINMDNKVFRKMVENFVTAKQLLMAVGFHQPVTEHGKLVLEDPPNIELLKSTNEKLIAATDAYNNNGEDGECIIS